ncbi:MAG TPA: AraC family transcriptional regulator, partial [Candidatus Mediterraneibacter colneyensis]|nr:AraC family transcriptional regulator [Candidatus Mediterraneibacter colneyensis]
KTCVELQQHIREVLEYIYENKKFNLSLSEASDIVHINPQYFSSLFKKNLGINYVQYMSLLRINYAKDLLVNSDMKIYEIGLKIGLENEAYFSRFFKKYTGESPVEYRAENRRAE